MDNKKVKMLAEEKKTEVSTLRGVRRLARNGKTFEGRVRTRGGYRVSARIRDGRVEVMDAANGMKWTEYPAGGKNVDPDWHPTKPRGEQ